MNLIAYRLRLLVYMNIGVSRSYWFGGIVILGTRARDIVGYWRPCMSVLRSWLTLVRRGINPVLRLGNLVFE